MKKLLFLLTAVLLTVGACKKDNETDIKKDDDRKPGEVIPYTSGKDTEGSYIQIPELNNRKVYYTTNDPDFPIDTLAAKVEEFYKMMEKGGFNQKWYDRKDTVEHHNITRIDKQYISSTHPSIGYNKPFQYKMLLEAEYDKLRNITLYQFKFVNTEEVTHTSYYKNGQNVNISKQAYEPYSLYFNYTVYLRESQWNEASDVDIFTGNFIPVVPDITVMDKKGTYKGHLNLIESTETIEVRQINDNSITIFSSFFNTEIRGNIQEDGKILFENFYADIPYGNQLIKNGKGFISYLFINNEYVPYFALYQFTFDYPISPSLPDVTSPVTISLSSGTYLHRME